MAEDRDFERQRAEHNARLAEYNAQVARLEGRRDQVRDSLARDADLVELLRKMAWHQTGGQVGAGWPEGVDPDEFVREEIAARTELDVRPIGSPGPAEGRPSEIVGQFRRMIHGGEE